MPNMQTLLLNRKCSPEETALARVRVRAPD